MTVEKIILNNNTKMGFYEFCEKYFKLIKTTVKFNSGQKFLQLTFKYLFKIEEYTIFFTIRYTDILLFSSLRGKKFSLILEADIYCYVKCFL